MFDLKKQKKKEKGDASRSTASPFSFFKKSDKDYAGTRTELQWRLYPVLPDWAENRGLGYFCFCRAIKILDPRFADLWATFKKPLADLCAFLMQMRQKKYEKTVKKTSGHGSLLPVFSKVDLSKCFPTN